MKNSFKTGAIWVQVIGTLSLVFLIWFILIQWTGIVRLIEFIVESIAYIPDAGQSILTYYGDLSFNVLLPSLLIGLVFGLLTTWLVTRASSRARFKWQVLLGGGAFGLLGTQVLMYPMQHCTYSSAIPFVQAALGIIITLVSSLIVLVPFWTIINTRQVKRGTISSGKFRAGIIPYGFLFPTLMSLAIFLYYPASQIVTLSLKQQRFGRERFVCLGNYVGLVENAIYQNSILTTFLLTAAIVILTMSFALATALLASQKVQGASIYRTLLIWPYAISPVVTGAVFLSLFRQGQSGLINYVGSELFGLKLQWLTNPDLAPWVIILASVWNACGFNILFYIAGLQNIPKDLLEAAQIDGANIPQRFIHITFPLLMPFTFFLLVANVTYSFYGIYGVIDTLTQGGPPLGIAGELGGATNVLIYKLYEDAFAAGAELGSAAAQSILLFVLVAIITLLQFNFVERRVTYSG